jgi:polyketide biosynthesis acyl carrier protein
VPSRQEVFDLVIEHVRNVLPDLDGVDVQPTDSLRDLGANSMDRAEIVMSVMDALSLSIPRVELFGPKNVGELVDLLHAKSG